MRQTITLRDANYDPIGFIDVEDNGNKTLRDRNYGIIGFYLVDFDVTKDAGYNMVGYGDVLMTLLK